MNQLLFATSLLSDLLLRIHSYVLGKSSESERNKTRGRVKYDFHVLIIQYKQSRSNLYVQLR